MSQGLKLINSAQQYSQGDHDVALDNIGRLYILTGNDKLIEDVQKILFTERNNFYPNYQTVLNDFIGSNSNIEFIKENLGKRIADSLIYLQFLQQGQQKYQNLDASEMLLNINSIAVTYMGDISNDPQSATTFKVEISITSGSGVTSLISSTFNTTNAVN